MSGAMRSGGLRVTRAIKVILYSSFRANRFERVLQVLVIGSRSLCIRDTWVLCQATVEKGRRSARFLGHCPESRHFKIQKRLASYGEAFEKNSGCSRLLVCHAGNVGNRSRLRYVRRLRRTIRADRLHAGGVERTILVFLAFVGRRAHL
jgi:hypothetical protein